MGRAIVREPAVFLMDEPLSNLDAKLRVQMRAEIAQLQLRLKTTTIYVTHDQTEAMTLGQRVAVLRDGHLQQIATPEDLYLLPDNLFVATFIGSPAMNLLEGQLEIEDGEITLVIGPHRFHLPGTPRIAGRRCTPPPAGRSSWASGPRSWPTPLWAGHHGRAAAPCRASWSSARHWDPRRCSTCRSTHAPPSPPTPASPR